MTVPRLVLGNIGGGRSGMKCSLPGVNALTADDQDPELFSFCSDWTDLAKLALTGIVSITGLNGNSSITVNVTHGLGYRPLSDYRTDEGVDGDGWNDYPVLYQTFDGASFFFSRVYNRFRLGITTTQLNFQCWARTSAVNVWGAPLSLKAFYFAYARQLD